MRRVNEFFGTATSKLYCIFLVENLPIFLNANLMLQQEAPQIHVMSKRLDNVITDLFVRYVRPKSISDAKSIFDVKHEERCHQKNRDDLLISPNVRNCIDKMKASGSLTKENENTIFADVRRFFSEASRYILGKFPLTDGLLENAKVLSVKDREKHSLVMMQYFVDKFPCLIQPTYKKQLELEFAKFQCHKDINMPQEILAETRVDKQWHMISKLTNADGQLMYQHLSTVMKGICTMPHSNADSERIFSLVRKNNTVFSPTLSTETLSALVVQKVYMISRGLVCHKAKFSQEQLTKAKSSYYSSLKNN